MFLAIRSLLVDQTVFYLVEVEVPDDPPSKVERVFVVQGVVVSHPGLAAVEISAAEVLGRDLLTGSSLHQGRSAQENGALDRVLLILEIF